MTRMRRIIARVAVLVLLGSALSVPPVMALARDDDTGPQVNIVEPPFRSPQEWTYAPTDLSVAVGTTITWTNTGAVAHTVTADDSASFDSGALDPQAVFSLTPDSVGTFAYHCTFHPWMTGSITVTQ